MDGPIHDAFELSYASYLVMPRVLLQHMPLEWQQQFVDLCEEFEFQFPTYMHNNYTVLLKHPDVSTDPEWDEESDDWIDPDPVHIPDPLAQYRHVGPQDIDHMRGDNNDDA